MANKTPVVEYERLRLLKSGDTLGWSIIDKAGGALTDFPVTGSDGALDMMGFDGPYNPHVFGVKDFLCFCENVATVTVNTGTITPSNPNNAFNNRGISFASGTIAAAATDTVIYTITFTTALPYITSALKGGFGWYFFSAVYPKSVTVELDRDGDGTYDVTWTLTGLTSGKGRTARTVIGSPYTIKTMRFTFSNWSTTGVFMLSKLSGWDTNQAMLPGYAEISAAKFYNGITLGSGSLTTPKAIITPEGGYAVWLTARAAIAKGEVCAADLSNNDSVVLAPTSGNQHDMPIGVAYQALTSGNAGWIVVSGRAEVLPEAGITATRGYALYTSANTAGRVEQSASPPAGGEVGKWVTTGASAGALAFAVLRR